MIDIHMQIHLQAKAVYLLPDWVNEDSGLVCALFSLEIAGLALR